MLPERVGLSGWAGRNSSPVAVISRSLDEMVGICGEFELSMDGLDEFYFAVYRCAGKYFLLLRYFNCPGEGGTFSCMMGSLILRLFSDF